MGQFAYSCPGHLSEEMRLEGSLCNCSAAFMESVTNRKAVPLPLGEGGAKRRVRGQVFANLETLTLPSPRGGWIFLNFNSFTPSLARVSNVLFEAEDLRRFAGKSEFSPAAENAVVGFLA